MKRFGFLLLFFILLLSFLFLSLGDYKISDTDIVSYSEIHIFPVIYNNRPIIGVEIWGGSGDSPQVYNHTLIINPQVVKEPLLWKTVEPIRGARVWDDRIDRDVAFHRSQGITPFLTLKYVPDWARTVPSVLCSETKDEYISDFAVFIRDVAQRYMGKIYIEIGNEPDSLGESYWYGCWMNLSEPYYGGDHYRKLLELAYPMVKQVNPEAIVVAGALMLDCPHCSKADWIVPWIKDGNFDAVSFHSYSYDAKDTLLNKQIRFLRTYTDKPLYVTETALLSNVCDAAYNQKSIEWARKVKSYSQLSMIIWYTLTPSDWLCSSLLDLSWNEKPVYYEWITK